MNEIFLALCLCLAGGEERPCIRVAPTPGVMTPEPPVGESPVTLTGAEFQILTLNGYTGEVTWDDSSPDCCASPITMFTDSKGSVIGFRAGSKSPGKHEIPSGPSVVIYANGSGKTSVSAWGVVDGKPKKLSTILVTANHAPQPPPKPDDPSPPTPHIRKVLFVKESGATLSREQSQIFTAKAISDYLGRKGIEFRTYDPQTDLTREPEWKALMDKRLQSFPCIVLEGKGVDCPQTVNETLNLLKRTYGE